MTTKNVVTIGTPVIPPAIAMTAGMNGPLAGQNTETEGTNTMRSMKGEDPEAMMEGIGAIGRRITTGGIHTRIAGIMRGMIGTDTMTIGGTEIEMISMEEITKKIEKMTEGITSNTINTKKTATEIMNVLRAPINMKKNKLTATTRMRGFPKKTKKDIKKRTTGTKKTEKDTPRRGSAPSDTSRMTVTSRTGTPTKTRDTETAIKRTSATTSTEAAMMTISALTTTGARNTLETKWQTTRTPRISYSHTRLGLAEGLTISRALLSPTIVQNRDDVDY
jgi:hypothetical protein